jgi:hypothetical protein
MPPRVPLRQSRWPVPRTPRWLLLALVLLVGVGVLVALPHRPSTGERASDLHGFLASVRADIESCAGGVSESLDALHAISSGSSHDTGTAVSIATYGAQNCSPANNQSLDDLTQYQVSESLASYHLDVAVNDLVTWAFPLAQRVQYDVAGILTTRNAAVKASRTAALGRDERAMNAERSRIDGLIEPAIKALSPRTSLPSLPG